MKSPKFVTTCVVAFACILIGGCGSSGDQTSRRLDLLIADCSISFRESSLKLLPQMVTIAKDSAAKEHVLWSGCFAGAPLRTLSWKPRRDFGEYPPGINPGTPLADNFNQARAIGLRKELRWMVINTKATEPGSGQLEALEVAAQTPNVARVFFLTDAAIHEPEVPELYTASMGDLRRTIDLWAPRLRGLHGIELIMIGVGYGEHNSKSVRAGRFLLRGLAERVGTASFDWTQELPPLFPS